MPGRNTHLALHNNHPLTLLTNVDTVNKNLDIQFSAHDAILE